MDCVFCEIIKGNIPAEKIYEDEGVLAFLDIKPKSPGHTLIIPKTHFPNFYETPDDELENLIIKTKKLAKAIRKGVSADGMNIAINNGKSAGQVIFHTHIHIIPRFENTNKFESNVTAITETIREALIAN